MGKGAGNHFCKKGFPAIMFLQKISKKILTKGRRDDIIGVLIQRQQVQVKAAASLPRRDIV